MRKLMQSAAAAAAAAAAILGLGAVPAAAAGPGDQPGARIEVAPDYLPAPYATPGVSNRPRVVERPTGARLRVPEGFAANIFAEDLTHPRWMVVAENGDVLLAEPRAGRITLLRDADGDGRAERRTTFVEGLERPHGLAVHAGHLYVADVEGVWRIPYDAGDLAARSAPAPVTEPGAFGMGGGHWTRNVVFHPDGSRFFVAIGSRGNIAEEPAPRATVQVFNPDGSGQRTFAAGLRNPVGIAFRPGTEELYVVVNERDGLGDELVPDYLTRLEDGGFYGWPYAYIGQNPQPGFAERRPDLVAKSIVPDLLFKSHSAPIGLVFYDAGQFPEDYRGDAFVALRGSWNAQRPRGYKVVRVPFADGRPAGGYENFATGFWIAGSEQAAVWGRPAGLAVAGDGSLLIADDSGGSVWRVSYRR